MVKQGMKVAQVERVIQAVPCVLKKGLSLAQAQQYEKTFQDAGGLVKIHNEDDLLAAGTPIPGPPPAAPPLPGATAPSFGPPPAAPPQGLPPAADPSITEPGPPPAEARLFGATRAIDIPTV